jgi:hypothetical protein
MGALANAIDASLNAKVGLQIVQGAQTVVTTNAGGAATVTFPKPFTNVPGVAIIGCTTAQDSMQPQAFIFTAQTTATYFTCYVKNNIGNGWIVSTAVRLSWVAIGAG